MLPTVVRFHEYLQRIFGAPGDVSQEVLDGLVGVFLVNEPLPSDHLLRGERLAHAYAQQPIVAGQFSKVAIVNPSDSGCLMVLQRVSLMCTSNQRVRVTLGGEPGLGLNTVGFYGDTRKVPVTSRMFINTQTNAVQQVTVIHEKYNLIANTMQHFDSTHYVLGPGWGLHFECEVAAQALEASAEILERPVPLTELRDRT